MTDWENPLLAWALPLGLAFWLAHARSKARGEAAQISPRRRRLALGLRLLTLLAMALALVGPRMSHSVEGRCLTLVVDDSLSTRRNQQWIQSYVAAALKERPPDWEVAVVLFAGEASLDLPPTLKPYLPKASVDLHRDQSDLASALQYAAAAQPSNRAGRLVLLSDGRETRGNLLQTAQALPLSGLELDTVAVPDNSQPEALIEELRCPPTVAQRAPFDVVVRLFSTVAAPDARLRLTRQGHPQGVYRVPLQKGENVFVLPQQGEQPGVVRFEAQLSVEQDAERGNNQASGLTLVEGPSKVAWIGSRARPSPLVELLRERGFQVDCLDLSHTPQEVGEWLGYQAVVLDNVSSTDLGTDQLEVLTTLVREAGVGLTMAGGPDSFAAGGYGQTPLAEALPVDLRVRRDRFTPPTAQLHVIDKSGSMSETTNGVQHIALAREASIASLGLLTPEDHFGVLAFDDAAKWIVPLQAVAQPRSLAAQIATLRAGGGTSLFPALEQAVGALSSSDLSSRHILILSDGATAPAAFDVLLQKARQARITVSTVAVGNGADLVFLRRIADQGKGRCYVADNAHALPRIFARETLLNSQTSFDERPARVRLVESHPVVEGLAVAQLPLLSGHNRSVPRGVPHRVLVQTAAGDPVLAIGRYGLGKTLAFTGDLGSRWSGNWVSRSDFCQTLVQGVRWTLPDSQRGALDVSTGRDSLGRFVVTARVSPELAPEGLEGRLLAPRGKSLPLELVQVAPDRYEARCEQSEGGTFVLSLGTPGGRLRWAQPVLLPGSRELSGVAVQHGLLQEAARAAGGRYQPTVQELFRSPRRAPQSRQPLTGPLVMLALLSLLAEVVVRRLPLPVLGRTKAPPVVEDSTTLQQLRQKLVRPRSPRLSLQSSAEPASPEPAPRAGGSPLEEIRRLRQRQRKP